MFLAKSMRSCPTINFIVIQIALRAFHALLGLVLRHFLAKTHHILREHILLLDLVVWKWI